jgi:dTMP kinase
MLRISAMLIVIEGVDGCGKSTQVERLSERLTADGRTVLRLREPGGTRLGEQVRSILLDPETEACPTAELFGYLTARAQLCETVIRPALDRGETVVLDRFFHSTIAYQGYGLGLDLELVNSAIRLATQGMIPDCALWIDVDVAKAARRRAKSRGSDDRIEARGLTYLKKVHAGFAALAESGELARIDGNGTADDIAEVIYRIVTA